MNLSDIRKKAQQEKAASIDDVASASGNREACTAEIVANPVVPAPETSVKFDLAEIKPSPILSPEVSPAQQFDPLALILAGRAAAHSNDGLQTSLSARREGADFQELLCFRVAVEKYAVDIMEIKEIIRPRAVTEVPRVPPYVSGVLSLRGTIIPVFNMHKRLGHDAVEDSGKTRIIVVKKGEDLFGVIVDEVIQVARISYENLEPPPAVLDGIDRDFVNGIGRHDGQMLILLNLEKILDLSL